MKNIKLIGLDLDGTVCNEQKQITDRTKEAIKKAMEQGVIVIPATGRPISGLPKELLEAIPEIRYALTANGAFIMDLKENKPTYQEGIPYEQAQEIIDELLKYDIMVEPYVEGEAYAQKKDLDNIMHFVSDKIMAPYFINSRKVVDDMSAFVRESHQPIDKIHLLFSDPELRLKIWDKLGAMPQFVITTANSNNLEINKYTVNKGKSLIEFGKQFGIARDEIMACGDGSNDLEMIKTVGFGVAMGNAIPEVKAVADYVTLSNDEDGVAYAIEKFVLK